MKAKDIAKRVLSAAVWALIMGGEFLLIYKLTGMAEQIAPIIPEGGMIITSLATVFIAFEIGIRLLTGTIFRYVLDGARAVTSVALLAYTTNFGVLRLTIPMEEIALRVTIDFKTILAAFLLLGVVSLAKSIIEAIDFASKKVEEEV